MHADPAQPAPADAPLPESPRSDRPNAFVAMLDEEYPPSLDLHPMRRFEIRPFAEGDFDAWYPLWRGYQAFYRVDIPLETSEVTWHRLLDATEPMHGAFALQHGRPVGIVHYIRHRSCWTTGDYCYLQDLFVEPGLRGVGAGRRLIEHVYAHAREMGCSRVHWLTHETNTDAMLLYDRIADRSGFIQYRKVL